MNVVELVCSFASLDFSIIGMGHTDALLGRQLLTRSNRPFRSITMLRRNLSRLESAGFSMPNIFERIGVRTIINAKGPSTRVSGAAMPLEAAAAMAEASGYFVDMAQLQGRASEIIAQYTGAQAGYVTSGAAAGLLLGTAACVTGTDPGKMNRLPNTDGMKNQVVVPCSHRNRYDHAVRAVGVKLIEVGIADRFSGAGSRDAEAWEIADAINERTAAVLYVAHPNALPLLPEVTAVAHEKGVPVIVDAAAQLPPASNLKRFIGEGADLVAYSGGKSIMGPQCSGILCGRRDLIAAAALNNLDMDVELDMWTAPESLVPRDGLAGLPHHGIGRSCKVGKEEIVGLLEALRLFASKDEAAQQAELMGVAQGLHDRLLGIAHTSVEISAGTYRPGIPGVRLTLDENALGMRAADVAKRLEDGNPGIHTDHARLREGVITMGTMCLKAGDPEAIAARLREILGQ